MSPSNETLLAGDNIFPSDPESLLTVERSGLVSLLLSRVLETGGNVEWDRKLVAMDARDTGVEVEFESGEKVRGDLVVGADGVHSAVRQLLYSQLPSPVMNLLNPFSHRDEWKAQPTRWTAVYGISRLLSVDLLTEAGTMHLYTLRGAAGAYVTYSLPSNRLFWIIYESSSPGDAESTMRAFSRLPYRGETFGAVTAGSERVRKVQLFHGVFDRICNSYKNVVLIGDAAHPQTTFVGQGAGRGLEESVELCNALLRVCWKEAAGGVGWFVENSRERSRRVAEMGWWVGWAVMGDWCVTRWARDAVLWWVARGEKRARGEGERQNMERKEDTGGSTAAQKKNNGGSWILDYRACIETEEGFLQGLQLEQRVAYMVYLPGVWLQLYDA